VYTIPQLADRFHVSTKTIARWRDLGLVSRRFIMDGRKRIGFLASSVDHFIHSHRDKIQRGEKFSQMTDRERDEIV
ncbi:MAG TPA: RNA polymerase subunit sigma-70, partial [Planctomycetaceae bacterium]|nr:RNA polymerase subunit sigma-70 [Planctomycetaceae bacterium]